MNLNKQSKPVVLLFNPFFYVAGATALGIGLAAILLAGWVGALSNTHFDGVLDTHTGAQAPLWLFLAEGIIDWIVMAVVMLILGKIISASSFRAIDVLGTQALARWPTVFLALLMLPDALRRFGAQVLEMATKPGAKPDINTGDAIISILIVLAAIPLVCWMVYLMYKSYSVSCNVKGGKAIGTFIGGLIVAEALSKLCLGLIMTPVLTDHPAPARAASPASRTAASTSAAPSAASDELATRGEQLVDFLAKEDFAGAVARFDSTMKSVLPEPKLREVWHELVDKVGPFKQRLKTRMTKQQGYQIALVTCQFEKAKIDMKVVFDSKKRVAGLFYIPSDSM